MSCATAEDSVNTTAAAVATVTRNGTESRAGRRLMRVYWRPPKRPEGGRKDGAFEAEAQSPDSKHVRCSDRVAWRRPGHAAARQRWTNRRTGADVRSRSDVAEAPAQPLAARHDDWRVCGCPGSC